MRRAPRLLSRLWRGSARGAWLACGLWLAGAAAAQSPDGVIVSAQYSEPTTRYAHGVLGDAVEWGALELVLGDGTRLRYRLPEHLVFEDLQPRLADLDGDGAPEVIAVEASQTEGARLAVWGANGRISATPHIGTRNRWLAPVGAADLDGDGAVEIAYVDRPHLARVLRVWRYGDAVLRPVASAEGFTNHRIGWDYITGGVRVCGDSPEMILASADWTRLRAVRLQGDALIARDLGPWSPAREAAALACDG